MNAEQRGASVAAGGGCPLDVPSKGEGSANDGVGVRGENGQSAPPPPRFQVGLRTDNCSVF